MFSLNNILNNCMLSIYILYTVERAGFVILLYSLTQIKHTQHCK